jgi:hypothetical protein
MRAFVPGAQPWASRVKRLLPTKVKTASLALGEIPSVPEKGPGDPGKLQAYAFG